MKILKSSFRKLAGYKIFLIYLVLFFIYAYLCGVYQGHWGDTEYWREWASNDLEQGLSNAYQSWTDYLPLYHYVLYVFAKIQGSSEAITNHIYQLKYFTLLVEFIAGFFLLKLTCDRYKNRNQSVIYSMFYFLNIFMFYNTVAWGQIDGILAGLLFISFFFACKQKIGGSITFFILALNLKLQAIIFLPVIGLMLLPVMTDRFSWKNLVQWLWLPAYIQIFIIVPYLIVGDMDRLWMVVTGSVGRYPAISMNAFNVWSLFFSGDLTNLSDQITFWGISYHRWGLLMFFTGSFFALFYLLKINVQRLKNIKHVLSLEKSLLIAGLIPLLFFYFNTQMHERYAHPALVFLAGYSIFSKNYLTFILVSIAYFINMETVLDQFHLFGMDGSKEICSILYLTAIALLFLELYSNPSKYKDLGAVQE